MYNSTRRILLGLLFALATVGVVFFILRGTSFNRALKPYDINPESVVIHDENDAAVQGEDIMLGMAVLENTWTCKARVVECETYEGEKILLHMLQSKYGFWKVISESYIDANTGIAVLTWYGNRCSLSVYEWSVETPVIISSEFNTLVSGNNAIKLINFKPGELPHNTIAEVSQGGSDYTIRFKTIIYSNEEYIDFDVYKTLVDGGYISG